MVYLQISVGNTSLGMLGSVMEKSRNDIFSKNVFSRKRFVVSLKEFVS